jgi:baculoviral IAP repeat-containing protein 6
MGKKPTLGQNFRTAFASISNCCDRGRLFGTWILLARFDQVELKFRRDAAEAKQRSADQFGPYGGCGFPSLPVDFSARPSPNPKVKDVNATMDEYMTRQLILLTAFLPSPEGSSTFNTNPPAELFSSLRLSFLLDRVTA